MKKFKTTIFGLLLLGAFFLLDINETKAKGPFGKCGAFVVDTEETNDQLKPVGTCIYHFIKCHCSL